MEKPLILGEAPSKSGDRYWRFPLSGDVGMRLAQWAGVEPMTARLGPRGATDYGRWYWPLKDVFDLRNLIERYPGPQGRGAALPRSLALPAWEALRPELDGRIVVLLGRRLPDIVFPVNTLPFFGWREPGWCAHVVAIPHPSGLNRVYNDPEQQRLAGEVLREARRLAAPVPR
jgi:uracil-DNA glycosylase